MTKRSILRTVEQEIAEAAVRIGFRLRFDKVAMRVIGAVQESLSEGVPEGEAVLFAITAPISLPAKTTAEIKNLAQGSSSSARVTNVIHKNHVHLRWIRGVQTRMPKAIGFVHDPDTNADALLDLAEARLIGIGRQR